MSNPTDPNRPTGGGSPAVPSRPRVDPMALIGESSLTPGPAQQARPAARVAPKVAAATAPRPAPAVAATPAARPSPVASEAAPAATATASAVRPAAKSSNKLLMFGGLGAAFLLVVIVAWKMFAPPAVVEGPRLNEPTETIAKFAVSPDFAKLPFERQFAYMEILDDHEDQVDEAYTAKKLTDEEYRKALQIAYLGKHLGRATKYAALPEGKQREAYLDKHLEKKKGGGKHEEDGPSRAGGITPLPNAPAAKETTVKIRRDESNQEVQIASWPEEVRAKWVAYRMALDERKDSLKDAEKAREKAEKAERARAATRPAK